MNMNTVARRILRWIWGPNREGIVLSVLVLLTIIMSAISPAFFTVSTLFSLLRSSIVPMIYALGVLLVIISGGIDVSFAAIASFASYATIVFQRAEESTSASSDPSPWRWPSERSSACSTAT